MNAPLPYAETAHVSNLAAVGGLHLRVFNDLRSVKATWQSLERESPCTIYQSFAWCDTWLKNVGEKRGITPIVVVGETFYGETVFILALQLRTKRFITYVEALTAPQGAYVAAIVRPGFDGASWFQQHFPEVEQVLPFHHVLKLFDLPSTVMGKPNALLSVRHFSGANQSHVVDLAHNYDELLASRRSAETRRKLRKRDAKLEACGPTHFGLPESRQETETVLHSMFAHQESRMAEFGVHDIYDNDERNFIVALSALQGSEGPLLRPYTLKVNGDVQAVMLGAYFKNIYWGLITSIAASNVQRFSPGDYTLRALIRTLCKDGTQQFDFSVGDADYKFNWSNQRVPLNFIVRSSHPIGWLVGLGILVREKIKRVAKRHPALNVFLMGVRRYLAGTGDNA